MNNLSWRRDELDRERHVFATAADGDGGRLPRLEGAEASQELGKVACRLTIERGDDVPLREPSACAPR